MTRFISLFAFTFTLATALVFVIAPAVAEDAGATSADAAAVETSEETSGGGEHMMPAPPSHPLFDQFKALEGTWVGTITHGSAEPGPATVTYELTAGGSALIETLFPGTPMEMVSVYFLDGDTLKMTHYCIAQNQPTMTASVGSEENIVVLAFDSATNLPDPAAMHMNNAEFVFVDGDHLRSVWNGYVGGEAVAEMRGVMDLHRAPAPEGGAGDTPG